MLPTSYHLPLVVLSFIIATVASYVALDVAGRIKPGDGCARWMWVSAAALSLGGGIWSMHFVAMLALRLPVAVWYDVPQVLLSVVVAVIAASIALGIASGTDKISQFRLIPAALFMGVAVAGMHYLGMAAMRGSFMIQWNRAIVAVSVLIAVVASYAALWLLAIARKGEGRSITGLRWVAAVIMGIAVSGMHYTGMYAAGFCQAPGQLLDDIGRLPNSALAVTVALLTFIVLAVGLAAASADRRFKALDVTKTDVVAG